VPTWMVLTDSQFDDSATLFKSKMLKGGWLGFLFGLCVTFLLTGNIRRRGVERNPKVQ
jgi:hypothetical protein